MVIDPQLLTLKMQEKTGMTPGELASLSMDEYGRLRQSVLSELTGSSQPSTPEPVSTGASQENAELFAGMETVPTPAYDPNNEADFMAWRSQRTRGGEGVGIFDSVSSQSETYRAAAALQTGRTMYSQGNVQEGARADAGKYLTGDRGPTGRVTYYEGR